MKVAEVKKIEFKSKFPEPENVSERLDKMNGSLLIDTLNWKGYDYNPLVSFECAYSDNEICLKLQERDIYD